jgi:hypothetical protein
MCINNDKSLAPIIMPGDVNLLVSVANIRINFYPPRDLRKLIKKLSHRHFSLQLNSFFCETVSVPMTAKKRQPCVPTPLHLYTSLKKRGQAR